MTTQISPDSFHRLVKQAIDSGAAASVAEAEVLFRSYRLRVEIDPADISEPVQQAALLTTVALSRRVFLGGVTVTGPLDAPLLLAIPLGRTIGDAVEALGGRIADTTGELPTVVIGGGARKRRTGFCRIPATFEILFLTGWAPSADQQRPLRPGSAAARLAEALGTEERSAGERAGEG